MAELAECRIEGENKAETDELFALKKQEALVS